MPITLHDDFKQLECTEHLEPCPCCGSPAELWQYSVSPTAPTTKLGMCSNGDRIGPQDGIAYEGCPLFMPNDNFFRDTIRDAVRYWNEFAIALRTIRELKEKQK